MIASQSPWQHVCLDDLAETCSGTTPSRGRADFYGGSIPWVKTGELLDGEIHDTDEHVTERALEETSLRILPTGTLLIAMYGQGQTRGRTGLLRCKATVNQACFAILPNERFVPEFLQFWFRFNYERLRAETEGRGGSQPNLNGCVLREELIPVPPLSDQRRIAARLHEQLAEVSKARAAFQAQLDTVAGLLAPVLRAAFDSLSTANAKERTLGELLQLRKEIIHPRDKPKGSTVFVGLEHMESGTGRRVGSVPVEMSNLTGRKPRFYKGDIVYGYLRPYLNKVWLADFDGLCSVDQYVFEVNQDLADAEYVAWFMRSPVYLERAPVDQTPGWLPRIRTDEVATVRLPLPPLPDQKKLVARISDQLTEIARVNENLTSRLIALDRLPAALLREAFDGKI